MVEGYKEQDGEPPEDVGATVALQNRIGESEPEPDDTRIKAQRTREELEVGVGQPSEKLVTEVAMKRSSPRRRSTA